MKKYIIVFSLLLSSAISLAEVRQDDQVGVVASFHAYNLGLAYVLKGDKVAQEYLKNEGLVARDLKACVESIVNSHDNLSFVSMGFRLVAVDFYLEQTYPDTGYNKTILNYSFDEANATIVHDHTNSKCAIGLH